MADVKTRGAEEAERRVGSSEDSESSKDSEWASGGAELRPYCTACASGGAGTWEVTG